MRCLPAWRSRAALAAMLVAVAAQVTLLQQRPRRLRLSRFDDRKSQGETTAAEPHDGAATLQGGS